jgi:hypothetical protein
MSTQCIWVITVKILIIQMKTLVMLTTQMEPGRSGNVDLRTITKAEILNVNIVKKHICHIPHFILT